MKEATKILPIVADDFIGLVLDENQIEKNQLPLEELFYLRFNEKILGPIWSQNLKEFLKIHNHQIAEDVHIRTFSGTEWMNLFEHPLFTRRKPQVVAENNLKGNEQVLVLEHGMPVGPYHLDTIRNKIQQNELILTDMLSTDSGKTWQHIYKFDVFDRRNKSTATLPAAPSNINERIENAQTMETSHFSQIADLYNVRPKVDQHVFTQQVLNHSKLMLHNKPFALLVVLIVGFVGLIILTDLFTPTHIVDEDSSSFKSETPSVPSNNVESFKSTSKFKSNFESQRNNLNNPTQIDKRRPSRTNAYTRTKNVFRRERGNTWVKEVSNPQNEPSRDLSANISEDNSDYGEINSEDAVHNSREGFLETLDQTSSEAEQAPESPETSE